MNTESILRILDGLYSKRSSFTDEELNAVDTVIFNKIDYDDSFMTIDFNDLDNFKNLKEIIVQNCMIDSLAMEKISNCHNLERITFSNCEVIEDIYSYFSNISTNELYFINSNVDLSLVPGYYKLVYLENMHCTSIESMGVRIDVSHCTIEDIDCILTSGFEEVVVSKNQYEKFKDVLPLSGKKIIVMQGNGQFIDKDVVING